LPTPEAVDFDRGKAESDLESAEGENFDKPPSGKAFKKDEEDDGGKSNKNGDQEAGREKIKLRDAERIEEVREELQKAKELPEQERREKAANYFVDRRSRYLRGIGEAKAKLEQKEKERAEWESNLPRNPILRSLKRLTKDFRVVEAEYIPTWQNSINEMNRIISDAYQGQFEKAEELLMREIEKEMNLSDMSYIDEYGADFRTFHYEQIMERIEVMKLINPQKAEELEKKVKGVRHTQIPPWESP